jgi:hypothetical protein
MSGRGHLHDKWWPPEGEATAPVGEWTTGEEPMTDPQASYLDTLAVDVGVDVPDALSKVEASDLIDELQRRTDGDQGDTDR